eukprot:525367_1
MNNYSPSLSTGVYGCYIYPKINGNFALQQKFRKIKQQQKYCPSISTGIYGSFIFSSKQRIISNPWKALPENAQTLHRAKDTETIQLKNDNINEIGINSFKPFVNLRVLHLNYNFIS